MIVSFAHLNASKVLAANQQLSSNALAEGGVEFVANFVFSMMQS